MPVTRFALMVETGCRLKHSPAGANRIPQLHLQSTKQLGEPSCLDSPVLGAFLLTILVCFAPQVHAAETGCQSQLYLGAAPVLKNPKLAAQTYPVCFSEISLLYSGVARTPLWSAEHLTAARIQRARGLPRLHSDAFHEELGLPAGERSELADYRRSGFDRGHMAPNGDMSTPEAQEESFSLANMIPQEPCNNEVLWEGIEFAVRDLALSDGEVYVVTGPAFLGAELQSLKATRTCPDPYLQGGLSPVAQRGRRLFRAQRRKPKLGTYFNLGA